MITATPESTGALDYDAESHECAFVVLSVTNTMAHLGCYAMPRILHTSLFLHFIHSLLPSFLACFLPSFLASFLLLPCVSLSSDHQEGTAFSTPLPSAHTPVPHTSTTRCVRVATMFVRVVYHTFPVFKQPDLIPNQTCFFYNSEHNTTVHSTHFSTCQQPNGGNSFPIMAASHHQKTQTTTNERTHAYAAHPQPGEGYGV